MLCAHKLIGPFGRAPREASGLAWCGGTFALLAASHWLHHRPRTQERAWRGCACLPHLHTGVYSIWNWVYRSRRASHSLA